MPVNIKNFLSPCGVNNVTSFESYVTIFTQKEPIFVNKLKL